MLLPAKAEVARHLRQYRAWERAMLASPADRAVRATFEDAGYTLCVLMGKRCAREAADAAERYLRSTLGSYVREQSERSAVVPVTVAVTARRPPVSSPVSGPASGRMSGRMANPASGPASDSASAPVCERRFPAGT